MAEPFTLQLHVTDACQLDCKHCYRDSRRTALPLDAFFHILDDFTGFCRERAISGRLTLAGGEPLLRYDDALALTCRAAGAGHQVHLLTNGLLLSAERIVELKAAGLRRAQISLDGDRQAHDVLRGQGNFDRAVGALERLRRAQLPATISKTLGRWNLHTLPDIIEVARTCHARLFVSRFIPCGNGRKLQDDLLSADQWAKAMRLCRQLAQGHAPGVSLRDPLYIPIVERAQASHPLCVSGCAVGYAGLAVDSDGTAYPCRRMPIPMGNLTESSLSELWQSPLLDALRNRDALQGRCGICDQRWKCGGCRAIPYALTGNPFAADPQCPHPASSRTPLRNLHRIFTRL